MRRISWKNCPYCGCSTIYASSSKTPGRKIATLFLLRLVRCHICMRRHFRPMFVRTEENPARTALSRKVADVVRFEKAKKRRPA